MRASPAVASVRLADQDVLAAALGGREAAGAGLGIVGVDDGLALLGQGHGRRLGADRRERGGGGGRLLHRRLGRRGGLLGDGGLGRLGGGGLRRGSRFRDRRGFGGRRRLGRRS